MMRAFICYLCFMLSPALLGGEFKPLGTFVLKSHFKVTGDRVTPVLIKPITFEVSTDGTRVRVTANGDTESRSEFSIYRSDGIGRQQTDSASLDIIPGLQAMNHAGGTLRHLRVSRDGLTITTFPGLANYTIVSHAVPVATPASKPALAGNSEPAAPAPVAAGPTTKATSPSHATPSGR